MEGLSTQGRGRPESINFKEQNGMWKGDGCISQSGRSRAERWYKIGKCDLCGRKAIDRHHKDGNPLNNNPENIQPVCRRCHMKVDGRIEKLNQFECFRVRGSDGKYVQKINGSSEV